MSASANCNIALHGSQIAQLILRASNKVITCSWIALYKATQCQQYQSNLFQCTYQRNNKKKIYQIENKDMKNQPKSFYVTFDGKKKDVTYLNKKFNKILVNFMIIKTTCLNCYLFFSLRSKLYPHVKAGCIEKALLFSSAQPSLFIFIVMSKAIHQFLRLGLEFKG